MIFIKAEFNRATRTKMKNIIDLYDDRKIAQFTTADKLIRNFINAKTDQQKQKASDQYNKVYEKHKEKKPLGERMQTAKRDNKLTEIRKRLTQKTAPANTEEGESRTVQRNTCILCRPYVLQI